MCKQTISGQSYLFFLIASLARSAQLTRPDSSSFLPQDKVAEFAKMSPDIVLRETMRAAGDPRLSKWHEFLCEKGAERRSLETASQFARSVLGAKPDMCS